MTLNTAVQIFSQDTLACDDELSNQAWLQMGQNLYYTSSCSDLDLKESKQILLHMRHGSDKSMGFPENYAGSPGGCLGPLAGSRGSRSFFFTAQNDLSTECDHIFVIFHCETSSVKCTVTVTMQLQRVLMNT